MNEKQPNNNENNSTIEKEKINKKIKDLLNFLLSEIKEKKGPNIFGFNLPNKSKIGKIKSNSCSRFVRTILYGSIGKTKKIISQKNNIKFIGNADILYKKLDKKEKILKNNLKIELLKNNKIYDILIKEYKNNTNKIAYHRVFFISDGKNVYTIDPFYDSDNVKNKNLNSTEIQKYNEWKENYFKENKINAVYKILGEYDLNEIKNYEK